MAGLQTLSAGKKIPLGARLLKLALDFDTLESSGMSKQMAIAEIRDRKGWYDTDIIDALESIIHEEEKESIREIFLKDMTSNMILAGDIKSTDGTLLVSRGQEATPSLRERLKNYARRSKITEPILVLVPTEKKQ